MKISSLVLAGLAAGLATVSMPETASADPPFCPPGHAMQGRCLPGQGSQFFGRGFDRDFDRRSGLRLEREVDRVFEEGFRAGQDLSIGDRLSRDRFRVLDRDLYHDRYGRPLDDRYYYAEADGRRLLIEAATGAIVDMLLR